MSDSSSSKNASLIDEKNTFVRFGTPQSSSQELNYTKSNSMPADMFCKLMGENYTSVLRDASVTARHHASEASAIEVSGDAPELTHYIQNETEALFSKPRRCSSGFGSRTPKSVRFSSNIVHFKVASPHSTTHAGTTAARCADDDVPMPVHADREGDMAYIAGTNPNPDDDFNPLVVMTRGSLSDLQSVCADNESVRQASSLRLRVPRKNLSINTEDCESVMHGYPDTPDASSGVDFRMRPSATSETSSVPQNRLDWCGAPSTPSTFKTMDSFSREPWSSNVPYERQHLPGERHAQLYHDSAAANAYVAHLHRLLSPKRPPPIVLPDDQCMHVLKSHVVPFQGYQHVYEPHQAVENHHFDEHNYGDQNYYGRNYETYQFSSHHYSSGLNAQEHAFNCNTQMPYVPKVRRGDRPVEVSATEGTRTNVISLEHTLPDATRCAKTQCSLQKKSSRHDLEDPPPTRTDTGPTKKTLGDKSLDARPATWSLGSELHHKRECKPCLFYHTNRGCHESADCSFCHYCPAGEVQHRRKEKTAELRLQEKRLRRQEERKNRKYKRRLAKERSRNYKQNECHDAELSDTSTKESTDYVGVSGERTIATFSGDCLSFCAAHPAFTREVGRLGKGARGGGKSFQGKAVHGHPQAPKGEGKVGKSSGAQQLEFATV